jgi:glycopeptide antibiotics resistance protein
LSAPITIEAGPVLSLPLAACLALITVPAVRRRAHLTVHRAAVLTIFIAYAFAVLAITIFPITVHPAEYWQGEPWWTMIHWIPFYVDAPSFVLNVIMTVPFGVLLPLLRDRADSFRRMAAYAGIASLGIELSQLAIGLGLGSRRTVDVNDLIANTAGAVIGLVVLRLARPSAARQPPVAGPGRRRADVG